MRSQIEILDNLWLPINSTSSWKFDWTKLFMLLERYGPFEIRDWLYASWVPPGERLYAYDPKSKKFDVDRFSERCVSTILERAHAIKEAGCKYLCSLFEQCGYRSKWKEHAHNPSMNVQKRGAKDWQTASSETQWIDTFYKPILTMLKAGLSTEDWKALGFEVGNEVIPAAIPQQAYLAKYLRSLGVPKVSIQEVVTAQSSSAFAHNKDLRSCVGTVVIHNVTTLDQARSLLETSGSPFYEWDKHFNLLFSTDGPGNTLNHVNLTEIKQIAAKYGRVSLMIGFDDGVWNWPLVEAALIAMQEGGSA